MIEHTAAPPGEEGRERNKSIIPPVRVRKAKWPSAPFLFSPVFDSVPYLYHDTHEAIISDELFRAAREERLQRSRNPEKALAMSMTF